MKNIRIFLPFFIIAVFSLSVVYAQAQAPGKHDVDKQYQVPASQALDANGSVQLTTINASFLPVEVSSPDPFIAYWEKRKKEEFCERDSDCCNPGIKKDSCAQLWIKVETEFCKKYPMACPENRIRIVK